MTHSNFPEMYFIAMGWGHETLLYTKGHFPRSSRLGDYHLPKVHPLLQLGLIVGFDPINLQLLFGHQNKPGLVE